MIMLAMVKDMNVLNSLPRYRNQRGSCESVGSGNCFPPKGSRGLEGAVIKVAADMGQVGHIRVGWFGGDRTAKQEEKLD